MKAYLTISTRKGYYASAEGEVSNVKQGQDWAMKQLDKLPDEIDGEKSMDWTRLELIFER